MTQTFGHLTVTDSMTPAQLAVCRPTLDQIEAVLGDRVRPCTLRVVPLALMPEWAPGKKARGHFSRRRRLIRLADAADYPMDRTLGHEVCHWLVRDWFTSWHRDQSLPLFEPEEPEDWADITINGKADAYRNSVPEAEAVYLSAALFGYAKPAYTDIYGRTVPVANWPLLADVALATAPLPGPEPPTCEATLAMATARIAELEAVIEATAPQSKAVTDSLTNAIPEV